MMRVAIVGMGPGGSGLTTQRAVAELRYADGVIGAPRLLEALPPDSCPTRIALTRTADIVSELSSHAGEWERACVAMSGDTGLFSGARSLAAALSGDERFSVEIVPGISSAQLLAARLARPWQEWRFASAHGVACDLERLVADGGPLFLVTGGDNTPGSLCARLVEAGAGSASVTVGERLSYPDERIVSGTAAELAGASFDSLSVMLIEPEAPSSRSGDAASCPDAPSSRPDEPTCGQGASRGTDGGEGALWPWATGGIPDDLFERGGVPMTKQEVRAVALAKLRLAPGDTVYDIGAGTGSVTVECALAACDGRVFAIERGEEGAGLIALNAERFGVGNVQVVLGSAPAALSGLPAPDAAFIGGSGGALGEILDALLAANPRVRVCVSCVTLETLAQASELLDSPRFEGFDMTSVAATRVRKAGSHHLFQAQNPVYLASAQGAGALGGDGR